MTTEAIEKLTEIVRGAIRAPSMHNAQPWRFRIAPHHQGTIAGAVIEIRIDPTRALPVADPGGWAARIACGAAAFGVYLGVAVRGHRPQLSVMPDIHEPELAARIVVGEPRPAPPQLKSLYAALPHRRTNRRPFDSTPAPRGTGALLETAAHTECAWLSVCEDARTRTAVATVLRRAQRQLDADPAYRAELAAWVRDAGDDGVPTDAAGPTPTSYDLLAFRNYGTAPRAPGRDYEPDPLVCVLGTNTDLPGAQVRAGMALHRVLLAGTRAGLASSMLSQAIEIPQFRRQLRSAVGRTAGWPQMVLRFGYGTPVPATPRRPVAEVLEVAPLATA